MSEIIEETVVAPKSKNRIWILYTVLAWILLAGLLWYVFFQWNRFSLDLVIDGTDTVQIEYGSKYQDPGYHATLRGSKFWTEGIPVRASLDISGEVNEKKTGKYEIDYFASFYYLKAASHRTVRVIDTQRPIITLVPDPEGLEPQRHYREAGFKATDNYDGDITSKVVRTEEQGRIIYAVLDSAGNPAYAFRDIPVYDITPPEIFLEGGDRVVIPVGTRFEEPGYTAIDDIDGNLTEEVEVISDEIIWYEPGEYEITYQVADNRDNVTTITRKVIMEAKEHPIIAYPQGKTIYLTFDDGPGPDTERLLRILKKYGVKATFFVVDTGYPEIMQQIVNEGHSIAIHTMSHNYKEIYASPEAYFDDLLGMQKVIYDITGTQTWLMRFPGGSSNTVSSFTPGLMTILSQAVEDAGFSYFDWNVDSEDAGGAEKASAVRRNVIDGVSKERISVVLQHDIHPFSVDAVEDIILWGLENGYQFLPLECTSPSMHHNVNN